MFLKFYSLCAVTLYILMDETKAGNVGSFRNTNHGVSGSVSFQTATRIILNNFHYDGSGTNQVYLYYYNEASKVGTSDGIIIPFEGSGSMNTFARRYNGETVVATMPSGSTVCDVAGLSIWCRPFGVAFGVVSVDGSATRIIEGECIVQGEPVTLPDLVPSRYNNCMSFGNNLQASWTVDQENSEIDFQLCSCNSGTSSFNEYMGIGLSREDRTYMIGADATITWLDRSTGRPNAVDYHITGRYQCRGNDGVCPDTFFVSKNPRCTNDIREGSISGGINDDGEICMKFSRPFQTADTQCDINFNVDESQYIVWAIGTIGETAFIHTERSPSTTPPITFGKFSQQSCNAALECRMCPPFKNRVKVLDRDSTLVVSIGPSALTRGYSAITGLASWGIAWYINNTLIPELVVTRGRTYTFMIYGGKNSEVLQRYHPFYITNSMIGGRLRNTEEQQRRETVYAGIDSSGNPTGVGPLCERTESAAARTARVSCASQEDYLSKVKATTPDCESGSPGILKWTPSKNTPDVVYYQCATHQNLGWKITVRGTGCSTGISPLIFNMILTIIVVLVALP